MKRIETIYLNEIIGDFLKTGLEISTESFKEWIGVQLDEEGYEYVGKMIFKLS